MTIHPFCLRYVTIDFAVNKLHHTHARLLCDVSAPILVICTSKHAKREVLDIGSTRRLVVHGIVRAEIGLQFLQETKKVEEKVTRRRLLDFERDTLLSGIVGTWRRIRTTRTRSEAVHVHQ